MAGGDYFSVPIFFILFRETTEAAIIVSVLLTFLKQVLPDDRAAQRRLTIQVWGGTALGLFISIAIGIAFIVVWNKYSNNLWANSEEIWEGCFSLLAVAMISIMGIAMLRTNQIQEKWRSKLAKALEHENSRGLKNSSRRYALFILPFITVLREGLEAIVFIGGVTFTEQIRAIPIAVVAGMICGFCVGYIIYRGGNMMNLHRFFVASTCLLLLVAAGLMARAVTAFEANTWNRLTNTQSDDAGTYDPRVNVWGLQCCNPNDPNSGGWAFFNAVLGWSNVASIGTILSYILYWFAIMAALTFLKLRRRRAAVKAELLNADKVALADEKAEMVLEGEMQSGGVLRNELSGNGKTHEAEGIQQM
ncbi:high-affinity iron permease [Mortierella sp. AD011]|nr:high-affinity iron permease [Mortierella sp. AD010]KAF9399040.1 high-affinity iron permease [Mortierella sp. AD011]